MAFSMPSFLWIEQAGDSWCKSSDRAGKKLKHIERSRELRNLFQDEIIGMYRLSGREELVSCCEGKYGSLIRQGNMFKTWNADHN